MTIAVDSRPSAARLSMQRLSYRTERVLTALVVLVASVLAVTSGAAPTGAPVVDAVLVAVAGVVVVLAAGSAPWWIIAIAACVATPFVAAPGYILLGVAGAGLAQVAGRRHADETALRSAAMAVVYVLSFHLRGPALGVSAAVGVVLWIVVFVAGVLGLDATSRRRTVVVGAAVAAFAVAACGVIGVLGWRAGTELAAARSLTDEALVSLRSGDLGRAASQLDAAGAALDAANGHLTNPLVSPAALFPVIAQHRSLAIDISSSSAAVVQEAGAALDVIDSGALAVSSGHIDLDAVAALQVPVARLVDRVGELQAVTTSVDSPWLIAPARSALVSVGSELDRRLPDLRQAADVLRAAPDILGADEPRRYLLLFTTPAEARAAGGFIGNYAEVTVDDGRIAVGDFRRRSDLEAALVERPGSCRGCPPDLLSGFGRFGFGTGGDDVDPRVWSNLTMGAHFPDVAAAASVLYPQSGGAPIDGVVALDPFVVQALMQFTGPVELPQLGVVVEPDDAVDFIVSDQYVLAGDETQDDRIDGLAQLGAEVIQDLLTGELPPTDELVETMAPFAGQRRLMAWLADVDEQAVLAATEFAGALPEPTPTGFAISLNNASGNKIDVFTTSTVGVEVVDVEGALELVAEVTITNRAPASGLPRYVIGNEVGLPAGHDRVLVTFYGPDSMSSATLDGLDVALERGQEAGWTTRRHFIDLAPGQTTTHRLVYRLDDPSVVHVGSQRTSWTQPGTAP